MDSDFFPIVHPRPIGGGDYTTGTIDLISLSIEGAEELTKVIFQGGNLSPEIERLGRRLRHCLDYKVRR